MKKFFKKGHRHMKWNRKILALALISILLLSLLSVTAFAATGDVAGAVENTWNDAKGQIKDVVNKVVFPVIDLILAVLLFVKIATAYMDYRKHGQFEWAPLAILLATLIFSLTCPLYIWNILGM